MRLEKGFTMAEVLITLAIIGIVAAMTLPSLINNRRSKALETALKKNYSVIEQVLNMYYAQKGERLTSEIIGKHELKPVLMEYMSVLKDCGWGAEHTEADYEKTCIPFDSKNPERTSKAYKNFNGTNTINLALFDDGQFVLNDGSLILIENVGSDAGNRIFISVDVNGFNKNPNRLGWDLFMFQLDTKGRLLPMGAEGTPYYSEKDDYCSPTATNNTNGAGCTYNALSEKDYFSRLSY